MNLYDRGVATLLASWEQYAAAAPAAAVHRLGGVTAAVFPDEPERQIYNNAMLDRGLASAARSAAIDAMESTYERAGVAGFAAWVHEQDRLLSRDLEHRGYAVTATTTAMAIDLSDLTASRPDLEVVAGSWTDFLALFDLPTTLLSGQPLPGLRIVAALDGDRPVASAMAFEHRGDCGIFNVGTLERARRRGLATALTAHLLHDARDRGLRTASVQSTPMATGVYTAVGFRSLGEIHEFARL